MRREEMLSELGVSADELRDFVMKLNVLELTLNDSQKALFRRSWPNLKEVVAAFGGEVTEEELFAILETILDDLHIFCCFPDNRIKNRK